MSSSRFSCFDCLEDCNSGAKTDGKWQGDLVPLAVACTSSAYLFVPLLLPSCSHCLRLTA